MIIHQYSEYEEPERPPFTLQDVIRAITDLMIRHGLKFGEALQSMLERGLPLNFFPRGYAGINLLERRSGRNRWSR